MDDEGCRAFAPIFITLIITMVCVSGYWCYNKHRKNIIVVKRGKHLLLVKVSRSNHTKGVQNSITKCSILFLIRLLTNNTHTLARALEPLHENTVYEKSVSTFHSANNAGLTVFALLHYDP